MGSRMSDFGLAGIWVAMGESDLRDRASAVTWSFPGIWIGLNLKARDLILKSSKRGLGMSASA